MSKRQEKVRELLRHLSAEFLAEEANRTPLITVTGTEVPADFRSAKVFVTVYPESEEEKALVFLKRKRGDLRDFVKNHTKMQTLPRFDFLIDRGEKHRQRIDELI